jgi:hypothetical protein
MKPEQKILLSCRQTSEAAGRLIDWLDVNQQLLSVGRAAVREDIDALASRLTPLARAAEAAPGIGLIATPGAEKTELLFSILAARGPTMLGQLGQRPLDGATIRGLLPQDHDASGCVIMRFCAGEIPPTPRGYPIHVGLLSMVDVAAIVTRAATSARPSSRKPDAAEITTLFTAVAGRLSPQAVPGLSERDVVDLRETLNALLPDHPLMAALAATRYWDHFREVAPHIAERDRRLVFAVLWRDDPSFTLLFNRLCDGLDRLGQGADAYCPPEALLGKDKSTGWMTRHPRSVIQATTLLSLDQYAGAVISVMNRYGQAVEVERAVLAALIDELPLHIASSRLNELAPAELLDFPVPPPLGSHAQAPVSPGATSGNDELTAAVEQYARAKAIYLFERACLRRLVTTLVVVAHPDHEDDTYAAAIGDWVETAQGTTAHSRERVRRGLFIAALKQRPDTASAFGPSDHDKMALLIRDVIGQDQDWPLAWTPNRPMTEVHWFSGQDPLSVVAPFPQSANAMVAGGSAASASDPSVVNLMRGLALASDGRIKHLQLTQALQDIRRRLRGMVLRHHASNDPVALADWRRGTAVVIQDRLQLIVEKGRLGQLQRALMPREAAIATAIEAALAEPASTQVSPATRLPWSRGLAVSAIEPARAAFASPETHSQRATRMAEVVVSHWLKEMRRSSRAQRLCRDLRIEPAILHHLIDELQIGAIRVSLVSEIAAAYVNSSTARGQPVPAEPDSPTGDHRRLAAYGCRIIGAYLEVLGAPGSRNRSGTPRASRVTTPDLEVADGPAGGYGSGMTRARATGRRSARAPISHWEISFLNLVEDNIAAAHLLVGRGDKDRELGELIALFASGPFEVEP